MTTEPRPPTQLGGAIAAQLERPPAIAELAQLDQWVISKYVTRGDKLDKPPFSPLLDAEHTKPWMCSHSEPAHWASYDAAFSTLTRYRFLWMGFVFHEFDPYSGVDLDGCCKPECECIRTRDDIEDWALRIIDLVNSYTEISPSGKGVKIFARGKVAETLLHSLGEHKGLEVYSKQRYFTVTGAHLAGTPSEICEAQAALDQLDREYRPARPAPQPAAQQARTIISLTPRQASSGRASLDDVKAEFNAKNQLPDLLAGYGTVQTSSKDYTCPFCKHTHTNTLFIYNGRVYSRSPGCIVPQKKGLDPFGLYCLVEHNNDPIAAAKKLNPIAPRKARQEAPPLVEQPARQQTPEQAADAKRKRAQRAQQAAETRAAVEQRAAADDRLTKSDKETLRAMLHWAAEHNSSACWLGRAAIAERSGYSLGSVKRSVMLLEQYGYFESSGEGGRPIDTAKRTFTRGSSFANANTFVVNDDPRIDITRDLPTRESIACERAPQPPATVEPAEWECWAATDAECSGYDLDLEAPPVVEPAAAGSAGYSVDCVQYTDGRAAWRVWDDALDQVIGEYTTEAAALAAVGVEQRMLVVPAQAPTAPQEAEQPYLADFNPAWAAPLTGKPYEGRPKDFRNLEEHEQEANSAIKVRADVADVADLEIEQQQLAGPPVHKPSKSGKVTGLDRYRADVALMKDTELAGELKKHKATLKKHAGAVWLKDVRQRLNLVQAELDQREGSEPLGVRVGAGVGAARPSQARRAAGPPPRSPAQQAPLFGGAD